jgi:hypothetical protein
MRQFFLALALIALPVAAFTGFNVYSARTSAVAGSPVAGLGDLSTFVGIVTDVQSIAAKGDLAAAKTRIKDFELAWDQNEKGLKPVDPERWGQIDEAADAALSALRAKKPDPATVSETLGTLLATLTNPAPVAQ